MDPFFIALIVLGAVAGAMGACVIMPRVRAPIEKELKPLYEEVNVGSIVPIFGMSAGSNLPYRLSMYEKFFVISTVKKNIVPYGEVIWLKKGKLNQLSFMLTGDRKLTLMLSKNPNMVMDLFGSRGVAIR